MRTRWAAAGAATAPVTVAVDSMIHADSWATFSAVVAARFLGAASVHRLRVQRPLRVTASGIGVQLFTVVGVLGAGAGWFGSHTQTGLVVLAGLAGVGAQLLSRPIVQGLAARLDKKASTRTATARTVGAIASGHPMSVLAVVAVIAVVGHELFRQLPNRLADTCRPRVSGGGGATRVAVAVGGTTLFAPYMAVWASGGSRWGFALLYAGAIAGSVFGSQRRLRSVGGDDTTRWTPDVGLLALTGFVAVGAMAVSPSMVLAAAAVAGAAGELVRMTLFASGPGTGNWHLTGSAGGAIATGLLAVVAGAAAPLVAAGLAFVTVYTLTGRHDRTVTG